MGFWQKFSFNFFSFSLSILILSSCSSSSDKKDVNAVFNKKYGEEVKKIAAERTPSKQQNKEVTNSYAPTQEELNVEIMAAERQDYYAYVDVTQFGEKIPQTFLPNKEVYEQSRASNPANALPPDMFVVSYNTVLYPPFRRAGVEFDRIEVPSEDAYGVRTEMSKKAYLLAGNESLQKNIDLINSAKTAGDVEVSEILIKEQKQLKRKEKMIKIFGQDSVELASLENSKSEPESEKKPQNKEQKESSNVTPSASAEPKKSSGFVTTVVKN